MWDNKRDTDVKNRLWTLWEMRVGWFERIALKHVYYRMWNRSPVQVWCMRHGAQGRCTGMTLRDGMGREGRECSGWGTYVHLWLIHVNVWQKPQYCKVTSFQLKLINLKKRMSGSRWVTTAVWLSGSLRPFLYSSSVFLSPFPNIFCFF